MNRTLQLLWTSIVLAICAAAQDAQRLDSFRVRSPNQRFEAEVHVVESDPRMARTEPRVELDVYELRANGERVGKAWWSGLYPASQRLDAHFLTDDGAAFVAVGARVRDPVVAVVRKGLALAKLGADELELDGHESAAETWIDLDSTYSQLRDHGMHSEPHFVLALVGRDGRVRRISLDDGSHGVSPRAVGEAAVRVEPAAPEEAAANAESVYLNDWRAPDFIAVGDELTVTLDGYYPTPGWTLLGYELSAVQPDAPDGDVLHSWTLRPLTAHRGGPAAQVTRPFQGVARITGLDEGAHRLTVIGRNGPPPLAARTFDVLPAGFVVKLAREEASGSSAYEIVVFADGRLRVRDMNGLRFAFAPERAVAHAVELARALDSTDDGSGDSRTAAPVDRNRQSPSELCWMREHAPVCARWSDDTQHAGLAALAQVLTTLGAESVSSRLESSTPNASSPAPTAGGPLARYELVPDKSFIRVRTSSAGLLSAFGHDHELEALRFAFELETDPSAIESTKLAISIEADSLVVVDKESQDDRPKIEAEMRKSVLDVAHHPKIEFKSSRVTIDPSRKQEGRVTASITGDLTLHGVTRSITLPATIEFDDADLTARGEFSLRQTDYGIEPVSAVAGTVKVADKVKLSFDVRARRK